MLMILMVVVSNSVFERRCEDRHSPTLSFPPATMSLAAGPSHLHRPRHQASENNLLEEDVIAMVAQLGLDDIADIERRQKGKARANATLNDGDLALALFAEEARAFGTRESDRALAQSLQEEEDRTHPQLPANTAPRTQAPQGRATQPTFQRPPGTRPLLAPTEPRTPAQYVYPCRILLSICLWSFSSGLRQPLGSLPGFLGALWDFYSLQMARHLNQLRPQCPVPHPCQLRRRRLAGEPKVSF